MIRNAILASKKGEGGNLFPVILRQQNHPVLCNKNQNKLSRASQFCLTVR